MSDHVDLCNRYLQYFQIVKNTKSLRQGRTDIAKRTSQSAKKVKVQDVIGVGRAEAGAIVEATVKNESTKRNRTEAEAPMKKLTAEATKDDANIKIMLANIGTGTEAGKDGMIETAVMQNDMNMTEGTRVTITTRNLEETMTEIKHPIDIEEVTTDGIGDTDTLQQTQGTKVANYIILSSNYVHITFYTN